MEWLYAYEKIELKAKEFTDLIKNYEVIAFYGNLGAGKTTFIKMVCKCLGIKENVSSPTFSIINEYKTADDNQVFHIDLYRLKDEDEAIQTGIEEYLYSGKLCFIEWPERASAILPVNTVKVYLENISEFERRMKIEFPI